MNELSVRDLHKSFGSHPVLVGVDLEVPAGSVTAVLGPSGSGKTTLLRLIAGFERADRGSISIGGRVVDQGSQHVPPEQRHIGYVPQEGSLFPHLSVESNVAFGLPRSRRREARSLLDLVGLGELGRRYPHQLSGGQQQRVALARALAVEPSVVLLDEPFASLDTNLRAQVRSEVAQVLRRAGATALLVTHDQDEALSMADRVAVLQAGRIAQHAPPEEVYGRPADAVVASFVGEANLMEGRRVGKHVVTPLGRLEAEWSGSQPPAGSQVLVLVRPEQIALLPSTATGGTLGRVVRADYHGHDAVLEVLAGEDAGWSRLVVRLTAEALPPVGSTVRAEVRGTVLAWPSGDDEPPRLSEPSPAPEPRRAPQRAR